MASEQRPNAPYDPRHLHDPIPGDLAANEMGSPTDVGLDRELQPDPQLAEGPASNTRIALITVGIAVVLGIVFYALNNSTMSQQASTVPPPPPNNQSTASTSPPAPPPGVRDVTPRTNGGSGTTTGNAPAHPQTPSPASTQPGGANTNAANPSNAPAK